MGNSGCLNQSQTDWRVIRRVDLSLGLYVLEENHPLAVPIYVHEAFLDHDRDHNLHPIQGSRLNHRF